MTIGKQILDTASPVLQSEKPSPCLVNNLLLPSRLLWLQQQRKSAYEEFERIFAEMDAAKVAAE